jgi:hypothetical protein
MMTGAEATKMIAATTCELMPSTARYNLLLILVVDMQSVGTGKLALSRV